VVIRREARGLLEGRRGSYCIRREARGLLEGRQGGY
jgi:hypothetical protein